MPEKIENPITLWDAINLISYGKDSSCYNENVEQVYNPFITNRAFSQHVDSIFDANEINQRAYLPKRLQFDYYFYSLRKRKRFSTWTKKEKNDNLELIQEYYGYSIQKSQEALKLLADDQLEYIKQKLYKGGFLK